MPQNDKSIPFNAWVDFNDPILVELDKKIRPFLEKKPYSLDRELQIRTLFYTNFNNYLTLLLSKADENVALQFLNNFDKIPENERLGLITKTINKPIDKIINNFIELFNHID
ncbi:MAG: hypothetical protein ACYC40_00700 [Patescibacteria group bacterium]